VFYSFYFRKRGDSFIMAIFKRHSLKVSDKEKTRAAELTLRESIYPLCLVTILFFLWVRSRLRRVVAI